MRGKIPVSVLLLIAAAIAWGQDSSVIKEIMIRGNSRVNTEVITGVMRTKVGQPYIQDNLDKDKKAIEDLGFFSAVSVRPTPLEAGNYNITVDVEEYPVIKEIRVVGNSALTTAEILKTITLAPGQVFNANAVGPSIKAVQEAYSKRGYFADVADFTPLKGSTGTINLSIVELKVGTVSVQGNVRTKDWVFGRLIKTRPGDAFSGDRWTKDLRRIASTGWFEPGSLKSSEDAEREPGKIDLTVSVKESRTGMFNVGLQIDPQNSIAGTLRLSENNLNGTGQTVGLDLLQTTGGGGASVGLEYLNPFYDSNDTVFSAQLYSRVQYRFAGIFGGNSITNDASYNERRTGGAVSFSRARNDDLSLGITTKLENVKTNNIPTGLDQNSFVRQDGTVFSVAGNSTFDRRDLPTDPAFGYYTQLTLEPGIARIDEVGGAISDQSLVGTHFFTKGSVEYRRYFTNQPKRTRQDFDAPRKVLAFRARAATISGTVPFFEQYFVGGSDTLRGYDEDRFWGKNMLITNLEYRYPIQRSFNAIGFVDYGGAWGGYPSVNAFTQSNGIDLHVGYGVGLSFRTPLGPIRIDIGFNEQGRSRTHFIIGTSF